MSRGLSQQQRLILGLAAAMSRHHYGEPMAHVPQADPGYRIPVAFTATLPDVTTALATHVVHGVPLECCRTYGTRTVFGGGAFTLTPETRARKNSASRAITALCNAGLLAYRPHRQNEINIEPGYLLTPAGLAAGRQYEIELPADIDLRLVALGWNAVQRRIGCGSWGYDSSIPLTFTHPKVLARFNFGTIPTVTDGVPA